MRRIYYLLCLSLLLPFSLAQNNSNAVWIVPIDTEITPATAQYVKSRVNRANSEQPLALAFLINTPGGRVDAMADIVDQILNRATVPTIALVEDAFSAGALIAMSAEQVAMLPGSSIGAALTVIIDPTSPTGLSAADEKINSATRAQFRAVAEARGRDTTVAEAMVDPKIEVPGLSDIGELVTLTPSQAVQFNIADIEARTVRDALEQFGYAGAAVERLEPTITERFATSVTSPFVFAALLAIGIIGILIELFSPGLGIPGLVGALALALAFGGAYIATPAGILDIVLVIAGILLISAEIFIIPGFGVAGILGLASIFVAVFRIFPESYISVFSTSIIFGAVLLAFALWMLPNTRFGSVIALSTRLTNAAEDAVVDDAKTPYTRLARFQEQHGIAMTDLRPAGVAKILGERVDVVTEGDFVNNGTAIEVLRVEGNRVIVQASGSAETDEV